MKYASLLIPAVIWLVLLSAKVSAMDQNTKRGIANFTLLTSAVFMLSAAAQPSNADWDWFNYARFEVGANTPMKGYSSLCHNQGKLTSSGEIRLNLFEYGIFYSDLVPWSHRSCIAQKDTFVIDTYAVRMGVNYNFK